MPLASKTKLRCSAAHTQLVSLQWYGVVRDEVLAKRDRGNSARGNHCLAGIMLAARDDPQLAGLGDPRFRATLKANARPRDDTGVPTNGGNHQKRKSNERGHLQDAAPHSRDLPGNQDDRNRK